MMWHSPDSVFDPLPSVRMVFSVCRPVVAESVRASRRGKDVS
jgi:hypothetical protein